MKYLEDYLSRYNEIVLNEEVISLLLEFEKVCRKTKDRGGKLIFAGNGASASISSQAATDFTQHSGIRAVALNDHNLISAFGNDYGYENWVSQALKFYADADDTIILISSSGTSKNVVNAAVVAKELGLPVVTFTGFAHDNDLRQLGELNLWANSNSYNHIENTHLTWILLTATNIEKGDKNGNYLRLSLEKVLSEANKSEMLDNLEKYKAICNKVMLSGNKVIYAGNGGSSSLSSHAAVDFTKQSRVRSIAFNDHNLLTCFANDYGQEQWASESLKAYVDSNDAVVLLSCSGNSKNILNAASTAKDLNLEVITFTGFYLNNQLKAKGDINFWVNSQDYSVVQAVHSIWIFTVADWLVH